jgi:hypothetical protein
VDGFSTKITRIRQELRVLVHPSSVDLSSHTLRFLTGQLTVRRREIGTRWRRLSAARQALLALAHLRCGDTYAQLAAGFGIGIATVYRYIREAVEALAALAPSLAEAMKMIRAKAFVILDDTLLPIDRIAADTPYHSGKHKRHGMNVQVLADPFGRLLWASPALPGSTHDLTAARQHDIIEAPPIRGSNAGRARRIKEPADPSGYRFGAAASSDGSFATAPTGSPTWRRPSLSFTTHQREVEKGSMTVGKSGTALHQLPGSRQSRTAQAQYAFNSSCPTEIAHFTRSTSSSWPSRSTNVAPSGFFRICMTSPPCAPRLQTSATQPSDSSLRTVNSINPSLYCRMLII